MVQRAQPIDGKPRFRLLETVRQSAAERVDEEHEGEATALRAADHFASWAVGLAAHSEAPDADAWLARALADVDNLRAAMDTLGAPVGRPSSALVVDAWALWMEIGYEVEGERRLRAALDAAPNDHPARPMALVYLSALSPMRDGSARTADGRGGGRPREEPAVTSRSWAFTLLAMGGSVESEEETRGILVLEVRRDRGTHSRPARPLQPHLSRLTRRRCGGHHGASRDVPGRGDGHPVAATSGGVR